MGASDRHDVVFPPQRAFGEPACRELPEPAEDDDRKLPAVPCREARAQAPVSRS